jgi:uncharacterized protein YndB with AHSA1/START domain
MSDMIAPLAVRHAYSALPARIVDGWVAPSLAGRWLRAAPDGLIVCGDIDLRPGGAPVVTEYREGGEVEHRGVYVEVGPPRRASSSRLQCRRTRAWSHP